MGQCSVVRELGQLATSEAGRVFREYLRGAVRRMIVGVMEAEVEELCGPKYRPEGGAYRRAGSAPGVVIPEGRREGIVRPRVRRRCGVKTVEVPLATYVSAQEPGELKAMLVRAVASGVSGREMERVYPESRDTSKSSVSRLWIKEGRRFVEELRTRDVASPDWLVLVLDGIRLSDEQTAIAAIGVTSGGEKRVLDFELGSTENFEVCRDLLARLAERGVRFMRDPLVVLDGSEALKKAVLEFYPHAVIQRCLVHKESNVRGRLSKRHWGTLARLFRRLREVQGEAAAREVCREIDRFLEDKNAQALASFREAGDGLIALHMLEVPATLHVSLLSTNVIENAFHNTRRKLGRVTRFRAETDQAQRWTAFSLLEAEKGFRRIKHWRDLSHLAQALEHRRRQREQKGEGPAAAPTQGLSPSLRPEAFAPATAPASDP
jgi:putative transposase